MHYFFSEGEQGGVNLLTLFPASELRMRARGCQFVNPVFVVHSIVSVRRLELDDIVDPVVDVIAQAILRLSLSVAIEDPK